MTAVAEPAGSVGTRSGASAVEVRPVRSRNQRRAFCALPQAIYRRDPYWAGLPGLVTRAGMTPRLNPYLRGVESEHFVATRGGACVGRIAAVLDPVAVAMYGPRAYFGLFESIDDDAVAAALVDAACRWAADRGAREVCGPYSYAPTQDAGLLIGGFDTVPSVLQTHNPESYRGLLTRAGFEVAYSASAYLFDISRAREQAVIGAVLARAAAERSTAGYTVRGADPRNFVREVELMRNLYNASFRAHPETTPISPEVFAWQAGNFKTFWDPELVRIVERDGRPVAFALLLPDLYSDLRRRAPQPGWRQLLHVQTGRARADQAVVAMIGAVPRNVGAGLGWVIAGEIARTLAAGKYTRITTTWVHDQNVACRAIIDCWGIPAARRYAGLRRSL